MHSRDALRRGGSSHGGSQPASPEGRRSGRGGEKSPAAAEVASAWQGARRQLSLSKGGGGGDRASYWPGGVPGGGAAAAVVEPTGGGGMASGRGGMAFGTDLSGAAGAYLSEAASHSPPQPQMVFRPTGGGELRLV